MNDTLGLVKQGQDACMSLLSGRSKNRPGRSAIGKRSGETVWECGWNVLPEFQGQGIATRATAELIKFVRAEQTHRYLHAFPSINNDPSNAICSKLGFTLLAEYEFEYPPGNYMRCNDWRFDLFS
jgi:RimJ/RimL family protein N-acetyltransferase